jgi:hypothetical protein
MMLQSLKNEGQKNEGQVLQSHIVKVRVADDSYSEFAKNCGDYDRFDEEG